MEKVQNEVDEQTRRAVYATSDSMEVGRFDLAYKYGKEAARLMAPPATRIKIQALYED